MKTMKIFSTILCAMLLAVLPATAQTTDNKNKVVIETAEGQQQLNTDEISVIRFDGGKITIVQPWGETFFDHTLRSLTFQRSNPNTLRLTASTTIGTEGSGNRAQSIDGEGKLKSTWEDGDVVYVYPDASSTENIGTLTPKEEDWGKSSATLSGNIDATDLPANPTLYFSTKDRSTLDLSSQDGTVESLFYFVASAEVTIVGGNATISNLTFERPIAVVKFTLKDKADGTSPVNASTLTVAANGTAYTVTPASATNELYVGIPAISSKTVTLTAVKGNDYYFYKKDNASFTANNYYAINVKMHDEPLACPLTLEAKTDGYIDIYYPQSGVQYTKNGGAKTTITELHISIDVAAGDIVQFYGNGTSITSYEDTHISSSAECYIYGNIMSLVDEVNYATATSLTDEWTFYSLFNSNQTIYNHASKELKLPATTLATGCYDAMFSGCTNLTTAPALPATTLANYCYYGMFSGCTGLTTAPVLPATTLVDDCYKRMFSDCTSLTSVTCLATDISADECTEDWLYGVPSSGTFTKAVGTSWPEGADGIPAGWTVETPILDTPLTFEAKTAGATVSFSSTMTTPPTIEYSTDGATWNTYSSAITLASVGDKVMFRGDNAAYAANISKFSNFTCDKDCYIYGNIMSLISSTNYANTTTLTENWTFCRLFYNNTHIVNHPSKTMLLPATTLTNSCYYQMFNGCTSLATAPALPATTLDTYCYNGMFYGCTSLATAPALPATTLANSCYREMFSGCTSLATAPALPATTLAEACYYQMFYGCTGLETAPALPATTLTENCYESMFQGCTSLATAPTLPATTLATRCYSRMFFECTNLASAPELPATTLANYCYENMFSSCTSLTTAPELPAPTLVEGCYGGLFEDCSSLCLVTCLATDISASYCTSAWLKSVPETGTFIKPASITSWERSAHGIPSGWTVVSIVDLSTVTTDTTIPDNSLLTGTLGSNVKISIAAGATVTLSDVDINGSGTWKSGSYAGINCLGHANIILAEGTTNIVKGFHVDYPGIHVPSGSMLTITGTGALRASGNGYGAGIGGGYNISCGNITINGGTITATGGMNAAGIGSGGLGSSNTCGDIIITGGTIKAYGGNGGGAGIGGGGEGTTSCGTITISGGDVTATGGATGAGIGSGGYGSSNTCGAITISGGTVTAEGGMNGGAGIGSGYGGSCADGITILNTVTRVTATKGAYSSAHSIGAGHSGTCGTVTIGGVEYSDGITTSPYTYQP